MQRQCLARFGPGEMKEGDWAKGSRAIRLISATPLRGKTDLGRGPRIRAGRGAFRGPDGLKPTATGSALPTLLIRADSQR